MILGRGRRRMRLRLSHSIDDHNSVAQVEVVAGNGDEALDQKEIRVTGLEKNDDVAAPGLAIAHQRHPFRGRRKRDAIHDQVIADEQGLFHRARGNDEVLRQKSEDIKAHHQHGADAGDGLNGVSSTFSFAAMRLAFIRDA